MSNPTSTSPLHPVFWIAGIAVTLFSLVGIAALTGVLPTKSGTPADPPAGAVSSQAAPSAATPAVLTNAPAANTAAIPEATPPTPSARQEPAPVTHHKTTKPRRHDTAALPPPAGTGVPPDYAPPAAVSSAPACASCGVITEVRQVTHEGQGSGLGAVGGGLLGGAIANNIGQGNGRTLATIAGVVGGGLLGNKIEKTQRQTLSYQVSVKMDDGTSQLVSYDTSPPWRIGDPVKVVNGTLVAR